MHLALPGLALYVPSGHGTHAVLLVFGCWPAEQFTEIKQNQTTYKLFL